MEPYLMPFKGINRITSAYGNRTLNGVTRQHTGFDIVGDTSTTVYATTNGKVILSTIITDKSNPTWEYGNFIKIQGEDTYYNFSNHLKQRDAAKGETVIAGAAIGVMGNTGYSFGAHTHYEIRNKNNVKMNPSEILGLANKNGVSYDFDKMRAETIGKLECTENLYRWRTGPGTNNSLYLTKDLTGDARYYCLPGIAYRVYKTVTVSNIIWCQITPPQSCITKGNAPELWVSSECGKYVPYNMPQYYEFTTDKCTIGDLNKFVDLAKSLNIGYQTMEV